MKRSRSLEALIACLGMVVLTHSTQAACTFGSSGEPSLQQTFNDLFGASAAPTATSDCLEDGNGAGHDGVWRSTGQSSATILLELAGFADFNSFGLYDPLNPANRLEVFAGRLGPGSTASLSFEGIAGGTRVTMSIVGSPTAPSSTVFLSEAFGFVLSTPEGNSFFSQSGLNAGGADHSYAYRGNGQWFQRGGTLGTQFGAHDAILAYEDLVHGDNDFQDFVVLVRGVEPIPLPAAGVLLLSAIAGLARRRRPASLLA
ncbi:MAG: DUF4114 domain-containing protein [Pseudomonadota bacterium]